MSSIERKPASRKPRRNVRAPSAGVIKGWPSAEILHREAEIRARRAVPYIVLEGQWLRDCGFEIGKHYELRVEKGGIVVALQDVPRLAK